MHNEDIEAVILAGLITFGSVIIGSAIIALIANVVFGG